MRLAAVDLLAEAPRVSLSKRVKNGVIYALVRAALLALRALPARLLPGLFAGMGHIGARVARRERRRALYNLEASTLALEGRTARRVWASVFANVGRSAGECLALARGGGAAAALRARVRFAPGSEQTLGAALAEGRGVVFASAHFGNWELLASVLAQRVATHVVARPSYDVRFSRLLEGARRRLGCETIWADGGRAHLRRCLEVLDHREALALAIDSPALRPATEVSFMGRAAPSSSVAAALAYRARAALLLALCEREGAGYIVRVERIAYDRSRSREAAATLALEEMSAHLGRAVERKPSQWLWSLDRWRNARYPRY